MLKKIYSKEEQELVQKAISFLVESFNKTGNNPKPVIFHSIRVAMYLYDKGADSTIVIAALLHDLLEDTQITSQEIKSMFGDDVAKLVEANSFKSDISDYVLQYLETFKRNISTGPQAVLIKASDLLDNADYYNLGQQEIWPKLYGKFSKFIEMSQPVIGDTEIWKDLKKKQIELKVGLNISI